MLTYELMGLLALWILWVNTILIVADAIRRYRKLSKDVASWQAAGLASGKVLEGQGPGGRFAELELVQLGRAADAQRPTIHYGQAELKGRVHGGLVEIDGRPVSIAPRDDAVVWPTPERVQAALNPNEQEDFNIAYEASSKRRGHTRLGRAVLEAGDSIWISGDTFVSAIDPRIWLDRQASKVFGFGIASVILAALCTLLALWPPVFGLVSGIGGVAGLAFFLLVQPAGTALFDMIMPPHEAVLRSTWTQPGDAVHEAARARIPL